MGYLSVRKFWEYQNADIWKKSKGHPPWFKHYVHRDREIDELSYTARLLWSELLASASRNGNVLKDDLNWLCAETRIDPKAIAQELPRLIKGGWLSQTNSPRRSRKPSRKTRDESLELIEEEQEEKKTYLAVLQTAPAPEPCSTTTSVSDDPSCAGTGVCAPVDGDGGSGDGRGLEFTEEMLASILRPIDPKGEAA